MPMFSTIRGDAVGPFFQGPRLRGTPEDDGYQEPEDDRRRCGLCAQWFAADELTEYRGRMYCEACAECLADEARDCPMCHGSGGGMDEMRCPYCRGTGTRETEDDIDAREYAAELRADEQRDKEGEK